jgi:hypothetical protein
MAEDIAYRTIIGFCLRATIAFGDQVNPYRASMISTILAAFDQCGAVGTTKATIS